VNFTEITTAAVDAKTYSVTGLAGGTQYYFRVRATNGAGDTSYTNTANATTLPAAPANLTATTASSSQINLSWSDVNGETQYVIERSPDGANNWTQVGTSGANVTTFNDSGLNSGTAYYYRVKDVSAGGTSGPGNTANATTLPA